MIASPLAKGFPMSALSNHFDRREHVRFVMPHQYTAVTVQPSGSMAIGGLEGHVYDISESGIRLELDIPLEVGSVVNFQVQLPLGHGSVTGTGAVVWVNDADDDPGPRRCALHVREYLSPADHVRLLRYLGQAQPCRAA